MQGRQPAADSAGTVQKPETALGIPEQAPYNTVIIIEEVHRESNTEAMEF